MSSFSLQSLWRLAFMASTLFAAIMAVHPQPPIPGNPPDTLLHIIAFAVLAALARLAYPRANAWYILIGLSALGGAIEVVQALPALGRDASLADWVADVLAISVVLGGAAVWQRPRKAEAARPKPETSRQHKSQ